MKEKVEKRVIINFEGHINLMCKAPMCCILKVSYLDKYIIYRADVDPYWSLQRLGMMISNNCDSDPEVRSVSCRRFVEYICNTVEYEDGWIAEINLPVEVLEIIPDPLKMIECHQKWLSKYELDTNCLQGCFDANKNQGDENTVSFKRLFRGWGSSGNVSVKAKNNTRDKLCGHIKRVKASDNLK